MKRMFNIVNGKYAVRLEQGGHDSVFCVVHAAASLSSRVVHCDICDSRSQALASIEAFCRYRDKQQTGNEVTELRYTYPNWIGYEFRNVGRTLFTSRPQAT